jgi:hypothetical protein
VAKPRASVAPKSTGLIEWIRPRPGPLTCVEAYVGFIKIPLLHTLSQDESVLPDIPQIGFGPSPILLPFSPHRPD